MSHRTSQVLEQRTQRLGRELLSEMRRRRDRATWSDRLMDWAMRDEAFKVQMFRFVDVFPTLGSPQQIHDVLTDYLAQPGVQSPPGLGWGMKAGGFLKGTLATTVQRQIEGMARRFIAGRDAAEALPKLEALWQQGIAHSVDVLGEACLSDVEADTYAQRYLDLIERLPERTAMWPQRQTLQRDHLGDVPRCNVSIKITSLAARLPIADRDAAVDAVTQRLLPVLRAAAKRGVFVNFDMEQQRYKALTIDLFQRCCERVDFDAGIALQAYLRSGDEDAKRIIDWARRAGRQVTVRLIKGAYWDYETIHAEQMNWPSPVWRRKVDTDACFERMAEAFVGASPGNEGDGGVKLAIGSHNVRSVARAIALAEAAELPDAALEFQMLHGMADALKTTLANRGRRVRAYVPVGEMVPGMAYLVRRLLENTSNESWLRLSDEEQIDNEALLRCPHDAPPQQERTPAGQRHGLAPRHDELDNGRPFMNEPLRDFADDAQRQAFAQAVARLDGPPAIDIIEDAEAVQTPVRKAVAAFADWRQTSAVQRGQMLLRAADAMRSQRDELSAQVVRESAKTWAEADADVCEAIDFAAFYARQAAALFEPKRLGRFAGEHNERRYEPRGVAAVISPWNFPLAICTGMTTAVLAAGNCAIVKPAEQTPAIAQRMCEMLWDAGVPRDVLHFLPGRGETVGAALVRHPDVAMIAFTGSREVGFDILKASAAAPDHARGMLKHVVCEMGGKNAIIIDSTADLDEAVAGVLHSAFSYAGQKCSACSRAIVVNDVHDRFVQRLVAAAKAWQVGDPLDGAVDTGPLIDDAAVRKVRQYIDIGRDEATLAYAGDTPPGSDRFVAPHVFTGVQRAHRIAREEIFGPVLAVISAANFDEALDIALDVPYRLSGGLYSRTPKHLARARQRFHVGNLYLNRGITGALVARQPFGGFGHSGLGTKAGGAEYLKQFVVPRVVTENTMRRGFAPDSA